MYKRIILLVLCILLSSSVCYGAQYFAGMSLTPQPLPKKDGVNYDFSISKAFDWMNFGSYDWSGAESTLGTNYKIERNNSNDTVKIIYPEYGLSFSFRKQKDGTSRFNYFITTNPDVKFTSDSIGLYVGFPLKKVFYTYPNFEMFYDNSYSWMLCKLISNYYCFYCDSVDSKLARTSSSKIRCIIVQSDKF